MEIYILPTLFYCGKCGVAEYQELKNHKAKKHIKYIKNKNAGGGA